jgi:hypothetical protein
MEAQQCYAVHRGRGATLASIMSSVSGLYRKQQRIQRKLKSRSNNVFNGNSRAEATMYSTETQERKQQRIQWKLKSGSNNVFHGNSRVEATTYSQSTETQERKQYMTSNFQGSTETYSRAAESMKRTLKSGGR